jgi:hypothetical protein
VPVANIDADLAASAFLAHSSGGIAQARSAR